MDTPDLSPAASHKESQLLLYSFCTVPSIAYSMYALSAHFYEWNMAHGTGRLTTPCQGDDSGISSPSEFPPTIFQLRPRPEILLAGWSKYFPKCFMHDTQGKDEKGIKHFSLKLWRGKPHRLQWRRLECNFKIYLRSESDPMANSFEGALHWTF